MNNTVNIMIGGQQVPYTPLPCLMQTAFLFKNGVHALFCTSEGLGLSIHQCDENFKPIKNAKVQTVSREYMEWPNMLEYHKWLRKQHPVEEMVAEHSTDLTPFLNSPVVVVTTNGTGGTATTT